VESDGEATESLMKPANVANLGQNGAGRVTSGGRWWAPAEDGKPDELGRVAEAVACKPGREALGSAPCVPLSPGGNVRAVARVGQCSGLKLAENDRYILRNRAGTVVCVQAPVVLVHIRASRSVFCREPASASTLHFPGRWPAETRNRWVTSHSPMARRSS